MDHRTLFPVLEMGFLFRNYYYEKGTKTSESVNQTGILNRYSRPGFDDRIALMQPDSKNCTNPTGGTGDIFGN
jgi:hypothetical protein